MKIDFFEIPDEGYSLTLHDDTWFPRELVPHGAVKASVYLKKLRERVIMTGEISATVALDCDRCLESFDFSLDSDFKIDLELASPEEKELFEDDHCCRKNEMDMIILDSTDIDITDILQQQLYLAVPMKNLCSEECRGICEKCGANLNKSKCGCTPDTVSPFHVLSKLKS